MCRPIGFAIFVLGGGYAVASLRQGWLFRFLLGTSIAAFGAYLASPNSRAENVVVKAIIVPELELRNVKMQIFLADVVEGANDPALNDRPKALNRVGVYRSNYVLLCGVVDSDVRIAPLAEAVVANPLIGAEQANLVRDGFADESFQRGGSDVGDNASHDVALAADCASDDCALAASGRAGHSVAFVGMFVLGFAANEGFVNFDNTAKLFFRFDKGDTDFVCHEPSGFDRSETHIAAKLPRAHALFAGQDQVSDLEPVAERLVGIFEYRSGDAGEAIAVRRTSTALPMEALVGRSVVKVPIAAPGALDAFRPATGDQISLASLIVADWEQGVELGGSHLVDWLGAAHGVSSFVGGYCHAG